MPTRQQAAIQKISPVLFLTVDGEPMSFFLRPGTTRRQLQPKIKAGGGVMCRSQQPGAILLIEPEARSSVSRSNAHLYVSTQYIVDCIEREEQLNVEDYRLTPDDVPKPSTKKNGTKRLSEGRIPYTSDDDTAILKYVRTRKAKKVGGNLLWREMEIKRVTCHSWQSMKDRYERRLAKKQLEAVTAESTENETGSEAAEDKTEDEDDHVFEGEIPSDSDVASPQKHSKESHSEEVCGTTLTNADDGSSSKEEKSENQQTDGAAEESPETRKAQMSDSSVTEDSSLELLEDIQPGSAESDGPQPNLNQSSPDNCPHVHAESPAKSATAGKLKDKQKASPGTDPPVQRMTRRRLELEAAAAASPEPYAKKLRSSSSSPAPSPQPSKKTNPVKASLENSIEAEQPPPKRARGNIPAAEERREPEPEPEPEPEQTASADKSKSQLKKKRKTKRKLGILELATKEFEDGSESDEEEEEEDSNVQDSAETVAASAERLPPPTVPAAGPRPTRPSPSPKENVPESPASSDNCVPDTCSLVPAAAKPAVPEPGGVTSKAHLFIFDSESLEDDSQRVAGDSSAAPSNLQHSDGNSLSFTQGQLEEDKQRIKELMVQTQQDLVSVTKALLKTSGDFSAALDLLLNPSSVSASIWSLHDDSLLLSADPVIWQQLQEKYGEESVAKRMMFLEVEG